MKSFLALALLAFSQCLASRLNITLTSPHPYTQFRLNLLESVAAHNDTLYVQAILAMLGLTPDGEEDDAVDNLLLDLAIYQNVLKSLPIPTDAKSLIDFDLVYKIHAPRIQSHFLHFDDSIAHDMRLKLNKECKVDKFGKPVPRNANGDHTVWVASGSKLYCLVSDLFAIETLAKTAVEELLPFDRPIGEHQNAPLLYLYADVDAPEFGAFFTQLYREANAGKLRFVWRYLAGANKRPELLAGYGVMAHLKNMTPAKKPEPKPDFWAQVNSADIQLLPEKAYKHLGLKTTAFLMNSNLKNISRPDLLELLVNNLAKVSPFIIKNVTPKQVARVNKTVVANEDLGFGKETYGLYINGAPIHKQELDLVNLIDRVRLELDIIVRLEQLGFLTEQAKFLIRKFALLSAVKQSQFQTGNTLRGNNENRFRLFEHAFDPEEPLKGGIVYFNDIEVDRNYDEFTSDRKEAYLGPDSRRLHPNQIPPLKENVHEVVFAIDFTDKDQLRILFALAKIILDNGIPQQLGLIPLRTDDATTLRVIERYYFVAHNSKSEALAFLYKIYESETDDAVDKLIDSIPMPETFEFDHDIYLSTLNALSITKASVAFNGVIHKLSRPDWQVVMASQIRQDITILKHHLKNEDLSRTPLREMLYRNAESERNAHIVPLDPLSVEYTLIDEEMLQHSTVIKMKTAKKQIANQLWIVGDFQRDFVMSQLANGLEAMVASSLPLQLRIINTGAESRVLQKMVLQFDLGNLELHDVQAMQKLIQSESQATTSGVTPEMMRFLEDKQLPIHDACIVLNSRIIRIKKTWTARDLLRLTRYEQSQRTNLLDEVVKSYPKVFAVDDISGISPATLDSADWFDLVCSAVTKSFYVKDTFFVLDVARYDLSNLDMSQLVEFSQCNGECKLQVLAIIDPADPVSLQVVSILRAVQDLDFVGVKVLLQPGESGKAPLHIFRHTFVSSSPKFTAHGKWDSNYGTLFESLSSDFHASIEMKAPENWQVLSNETSKGLDLSSVAFQTATDDCFALYLLASILIEGYARDVGQGQPMGGVPLQIAQKLHVHETSILNPWNYIQLPAGPGTWSVSLVPGSHQYALLSCGEVYARNKEPMESVSVSVFTLGKKTVHCRFTPVAAKNPKKRASLDDTINVFSVASGAEYERLLRTMFLSVRKHSTRPLKFWILEPFLSAEFKLGLPRLAEKYGFEFAYVNYKWPYFLRSQEQLHRRIWGYKILFLDVLFPQSVDKVIYVDADQIARSDLQRLVETDMQGAPYAFTPMCESNKETEGFQFWKQEGGFWQTYLKEDLKYHISALFAVDLTKFREMGAGDVLRGQYQKISADANSLANLDQDLPNSVQRAIPIHSLEQQWLWCETWCSEASKKEARMIDLCTNPLRAEAKASAAKRVIPEWEGYDAEISRVLSGVSGSESTIDPRFRFSDEEAGADSDGEDTDHDAGQGGDWGHDEL